MKKYTPHSYSAYIKDNPKGYWFKRKLFGWGWVPVKIEGWAIVLGFVAMIILNAIYLAFRAGQNPPTTTDLAIFISIIIILVIALIAICYKKGEKPRWSWGS